jgi:thioredoxin-dependent peroxiredoxin
MGRRRHSPAAQRPAIACAEFSRQTTYTADPQGVLSRRRSPHSNSGRAGRTLFMLRRVTASQSRLPEVGQPAPNFTLTSTEGNDVSLSNFKGKQSVVLYFYPRDDTPGCTAEACSFRDLRTLFNENGAEILGVSPDTIKSHKKFQDKFHLNFPLLADPDHQVAEQYGVWQLKKFMGREYMGIARTTFVIGPDGNIKAVFPNVKVEGHADKVLQALKS